LKYFLKYLQKNEDDSPLYVFDGSFDEDSVSKSILTDYKVPKYFRDDLFSLVGEKKRPPYRWFLIGPARSGSCVHIDPLATSAWNTVIRGRKRWVLFPPGTPRSIVKGLDVILKGEDDEAINYFVDILPRIRKKYGSTVPIIEFIQEAGETVFVPGGWWHGVLNLGPTIAVTQNFCSYSNFEKVWEATRKGRKKMSVKWLSRLEEEHPSLAQTAISMNQRDGFEVKGGRFVQDLNKAVEGSSGGSGSSGVGSTDKSDDVTSTASSPSLTEKNSDSGSRSGGSTSGDSSDSSTISCSDQH
jgi:histone arginine demethylase JMJD6